MAPRRGHLAALAVVAAAAGMLVKKFQRPLDPAAHSVGVQPVPSRDYTGARVAEVEGSHGVRLYARTWPAPSTPKACVLMVHGLTWHGAYFQPAALALNEAGYTVVAVDLPAHGLSGSSHGVRAYHPSREGYLDCIEAMLGHAAAACPPGTPLFAYGESLGGGLLTTTIAARPEVAARLAGVVIAGMPCGTPSTLPPAPVVSVILALAKALPLAPMPPDDTTKREHWISAFGDLELANKAFDTDTLLPKQIPLGTAGVVLPLLRGLRAAAPDVALPLLLLHGREDTRAPLQLAEAFFADVASEDKTMRAYEGMRHQLMQETPENLPRIMSDLLSWLDARVGAQPAA